MVLDNYISDIIDVLSGVLQGSILLLFVLVINDIFHNIDKIRSLAFTLMIPNCRVKLQLRLTVTSFNITLILFSLNKWCIDNKMKFSTDKWKVLTVLKSETMFINELPFCKYPYTLGQKILDYTLCKREF